MVLLTNNSNRGMSMVGVVTATALLATFVALTARVHLSAKRITGMTEEVGAVRDVAHYLRQNLDCAATVQAPECSTDLQAVVEAKSCTGAELLSGSTPYSKIANWNVRAKCGTGIGTNRLLLEYKATLANGSQEWQPMNRGVPMLCSSRPLAAISMPTFGNVHGCGIADSAAVCWRTNVQGSMGVENLPDTTSSSSDPGYCPHVVTGMSSGVTLIKARTVRTCAIQGSELKCWGLNGPHNHLGNLSSRPLKGSGFQTYSDKPLVVEDLEGVPTDFSLGPSHACVIVDGRVKCWGSNVDGKLGNNQYSGDRPESSGTPKHFVAGIPLGRQVTKLVTGANFSCALAGGDVFCWGSNEEQQLGNNEAVNTNSHPTYGVNKFNYAIPVLGLPSGAVTDIVTAQSGEESWHVCALAGGDVWCWGDRYSKDHDSFFRQGFPIGSGVVRKIAGLPRPISGFVSTPTSQGGVVLHGNCALYQGDVICFRYDATGAVYSLDTAIAKNSGQPVVAAFRLLDNYDYSGWIECADFGNNSWRCRGSLSAYKTGHPSQLQSSSDFLEQRDKWQTIGCTAAEGCQCVTSSASALSIPRAGCGTH